MRIQFKINSKSNLKPKVRETGGIVRNSYDSAIYTYRVETLKTRRLFRHPFYEKQRQSTRLARLLLVETLKRNPLELKDTPNSTYKAFRIYVFAWPDGLDDICQQRNMTLDHPSRSQVSSDTREKKGGKRRNAETFQSIAQFNKKFPRVARNKNGKNFNKFLKQSRFLEIYV